MALVITLILLSVITFMAIAFLVISRAGKGAVTTTTDQTIARLAADAGFERAQAELLAPILCSTNPHNYGLMVSTNYINAIGFIPGLVHPTNVNYEYTAARTPLSPAQQLQNIANLLYNPRPPVYIANRLTGVPDFRFYLDLNRNGRYDTNGFLPVINPMGGYYDTNGNWVATILPGNTVSNFFVGDPEWIGGLEFPTRAHAADNKFVYRYAYMVVPVGNTLDLNYIHNYAKGIDQNMPIAGGDFFFRNQGVGSWEINLAAFLADLNTNYWPSAGNLYTYNWDKPNFNSGPAFDDAFALLRYRYAGSTGTLASATRLFGTPGANAFKADFIDGYCAGPAMIGTWWPGSSIDGDTPHIGLPWSGANNTNHYFTIQEIFDPNKTSFYFTNRLISASTNIDSYNRYTFYRLLSQMGTDSAPENPPATPKPVIRWDVVGTNILAVVTNHGYFSGDWVTLLPDRAPYPANPFKISVTNAHTLFLLGAAGKVDAGARLSTLDPSENVKIDLNYDNINYARKTFTPWNPTDFFTSVADRLLRRQNGAFLHHIVVHEVFTNALGEVITNNAYTPSVHRLLQLAANIYDSTTNRPAGTDSLSLLPPYPPTVFRPIFRRDGSAPNSPIVIAGYREVIGTNLVYQPTAPPMMLAEVATNISTFGTSFMSDQQEPLIVGVPLVIGAKKGYPNFNEFAMQNALQISRRLRFTLDSQNKKVVSTNQMLILGMTNSFGVEVWNSYPTNFPRKLSMTAVVDITAEIATNAFGGQLLLAHKNTWGTLDVPANTWAGYVQGVSEANSFRIPLSNSVVLMPDSTYSANLGRFVGLTNFYESPPAPFYLPHWYLKLNTQVTFFLLDNNNIVDYVTLRHEESTLDLAYELTKNSDCDNADLAETRLWCTNRMYGAAANNDSVPSRGIMAQISISKGGTPATWNSYNLDPTVPKTTQQAIGAFWYNLHGVVNGLYPGTYYRSNTFFAPYVPVATRFTKVSWQANDPLVHYTIGDLMNLQTTPSVEGESDQPHLKNFKSRNPRYEPWGMTSSSSSAIGQYDLAFKDPLVTSSAAWDFPTNKYPNIGWLGRVHRGTPWQTVYLKSPISNPAAWTNWTGNPIIIRNKGQIDTNVLAFNAVTNDAAFTQPANDRALFDIFTTSFNDNAAMGRMSVNQTNLAAWSAILSGVIVMNNNVPDNALFNGAVPQYAPHAIEPAKAYNPFAPSNTFPAVARIVHGINYARSLTPAKSFTHLGDILAAPELTVTSPFLNITNNAQTRFGISDAAYERIPQQILGLLKCDSTPRFIVYSYGQALKPADRSIVTAGPYFGLCTNYQIKAEVATRAVVRIEGAPKNPHAVIESYNVLPPD